MSELCYLNSCLETRSVFSRDGCCHFDIWFESWVRGTLSRHSFIEVLKHLKDKGIPDQDFSYSSFLQFLSVAIGLDSTCIMHAPLPREAISIVSGLQAILIKNLIPEDQLHLDHPCCQCLICFQYPVYVFFPPADQSLPSSGSGVSATLSSPMCQASSGSTSLSCLIHHPQGLECLPGITATMATYLLTARLLWGFMVRVWSRVFVVQYCVSRILDGAWHIRGG